LKARTLHELLEEEKRKRKKVIRMLHCPNHNNY
jgi:hypothetical protein